MDNQPNQQPSGIPVPTQPNPTLAPPQYPPVMMYQTGQPQYAYAVPVQNVPVQIPQQQVIYYQPQPVPVFQENIPISQPLLTPSNEPSHFHASLKHRLIERNYEVDMVKWLGDGWRLYKEHWAFYSFFTLFYILVSCIPYVGTFFALGLLPGVFIAGMHQIRPTTGFSAKSLFHGYYYYFPLLLIYFIYALAILVGFFLLIIPGFYFAIALSFAPFVYLEFHNEHIGIMDAFTISRKAITKKFCTMFLFFIIIYLTNVVGCLFFIIGVLVSLPVTQLSCVIAFRDMFGLSESRVMDHHCVCC